MFDFLLVAMFASFMLAISDYVKELFSVVTSEVFANATFSLGFSYLGFFLMSTPVDKSLAVKVIAGAFAGRSILAITERLASSRPVVINQARQ